MKTAILLRLDSSFQGTFGVFSSEGFSCFISELPWRDNTPQLSSIPAGQYVAKWIKSPKFGWCYQVLNVVGRGNILIHKGNYVGASDKGFKTNSHGCLLPASKLGTLGGQKAGLLSGPATANLYQHFNQKDFQLEIKDAYSNNSTSK